MADQLRRIVCNQFLPSKHGLFPETTKSGNLAPVKVRNLILVGFNFKLSQLALIIWFYLVMLHLMGLGPSFHTLCLEGLKSQLLMLLEL